MGTPCQLIGVAALLMLGVYALRPRNSAPTLCGRNCRCGIAGQPLLTAGDVLRSVSNSGLLPLPACSTVGGLGATAVSSAWAIVVG